MVYNLVIESFSSGLNELLKAQTTRYDSRTRRVKVWNNEKSKNDRMFRNAIRSQLGKLEIKSPIVVHFKFFTNYKHDIDNLSAGARKSLFDALQETKVIPQDNSKVVYGFTDDYEINSNYKNTKIYIAIEEVKKRPKDVWNWSEFN